MNPVRSEASAFNFLMILCFLAVGLVLTTPGQNAKVASVISEQYVIKSKILGEDRSVLVRVPANYTQTDEKFPVVYMLDAHPPQNAMMAGIIEQQAWSKEIPEMILVGIQNTDRTRDMTPTRTADSSNGGGADKFLEFIAAEVMPLVEQKYRTEPYRIFAGHSFGGLAVVYAALTRPELFNAYLAASPSLEWDHELIIRRAEDIFKQKKDWNKTMFLAMGNEPESVKSFNAFKDLLDRAKPKNLEYEFRQMPEENHASVVLQAYYWGLRKIYAGWIPPATGSIAELESHYKKLSERYGYQINIPENMLNQIGYQYLKAGKTAEAVEILKRNAAIYPNSANVYDSLAEAYEKNDQLRQARENYEKAYRLAEAQGNLPLARSSKANYERLSK